MLLRIPEKYFEVSGSVFGFLSSATIAAQVHAEYSTDRPSTVSLVYAGGFLVIFAFWTLYGLRFKRLALWLTNAIAVCMQTLLLIAILSK